MVGKVTMKVEGLRELDAALGELPKATARSVLRRVGIKALEPMAETARQLAPDDPATSGNDLKASIAVGTKLTPRQAKLNRRAIRSGEAEKHFQEVYMGTADPAGIQQEFGNVNHGPQAFIRPAFEQHKQGAVDIVAKELGGEIEKAAKRIAARAARLAAKG